MDFTQEVLEIQAGIAWRSTRMPAYRNEEIPVHHLVPRDDDPHMWSIRVKV